RVVHPFAYNADFVFAGGRCYSSNGKIFDPHTGEIFGGFYSVDIKMILPDLASNRLFTAEETNKGLVIKAQDLITLATIGTITIPNVPENPGWLQRWGTDGLAFRADGKFFLIRDKIVGNTPPVVTNITPGQGYRGNQVVITGKDFTDTYSLKFNGFDANFTVNSDTQITTTVPLNATTGPISISSVGGKTETAPFTVLDRLLSVGDVNVIEGSSGTSNLSFTVNLSEASTAAVSFRFKTADGTATAGQDYTAVDSVITIAAGATTALVNVPILGDTTKELDEAFTVQLSEPVNSVLGDANATGTIVEDDVPTLSIADASVVEGASGTQELVFTVTLAEAGLQPVTFKYATANSTAKAGEDYGAKSSTGTIAAGQLSTTIAVVVNGDTLPETDEFFNLNLTEIKGAILKRSSAVGTITNDDATPTISVNSVTVPEGNSGTTDATFQVTLSTASSQSVTVKFATANGTAVAGNDFTAQNGTLTFGPGETTKAIVVKIKGDTLDEDDEQFGLKLTDPINATLLVGQGSAKITDNDAAPTVSINSVSGIETAKNLVFTVALSAPSAKPVKVAYITANGTAKAKLDYLATTGEL
ncbi:hypothetical protein EON80_22620, partial [bacterium]